ncbi:MAG TPA: helix-turn-helix transcriptional regulator [Acidobacteriota bacterium]
MSRGKYLGEFEQMVLLAVARLGDGAYGMRIRREIEACSGRHVAIGAVYATLERLREKGHVRTQAGDTSPERDGRARKFFTLTKGGVDVLEKARAVQDRLWAGLDLRRDEGKA